MTPPATAPDMDGVLLVDKPTGLTSHDVVQRVRRTSGERRIGHTGTLDPMATGLLPLVVGRATRLASLLTGREKTYDAVVRLGVRTDTDDAEGTPTAAAEGPLPDDAAVQAALERFRGTFDQVPPDHSAKKIAGRRAYQLARQARPVALAPVTVTVRHLTWTGRDEADVHLRVTATAGFYVRALARDLGNVLGCGAHLAGLRRTASGRFRVEEAMSLEEVLTRGPEVADRLISPADALADLPAVRVTDRGLRRAVHGNPLEPADLAAPAPPSPPGAPARPVRVLSADGRLVALAQARGGLLHPVVVLG